MQFVVISRETQYLKIEMLFLLLKAFSVFIIFMQHVDDGTRYRSVVTVLLQSIFKYLIITLTHDKCTLDGRFNQHTHIQINNHQKKISWVDETWIVSASILQMPGEYIEVRKKWRLRYDCKFFRSHNWIGSTVRCDRTKILKKKKMENHLKRKIEILCYFFSVDWLDMLRFTSAFQPSSS